VVATLPAGTGSAGVAVTPDGKHVYVTGGGCSVIDTTSNTVVATIPAGIGPSGVGIIPPQLGVPFSAFNARLAIDLDRASKRDCFELQSSFTLGSVSSGINPPVEPVTLKVGTFTTIIPPGSFKIADDQDDQNDQEEGVGVERFGPLGSAG
jgi:YVTN family beta-propeller protein